MSAKESILANANTESAKAGSKPWSRYLYRLLAREISKYSKYYDQVLQLSPLDSDNMHLFEQIQCPTKNVVPNIDALPNLSFDKNVRTTILLNGNFNYSNDIQGLLKAISPKLSRSSRITVVAYNPYFSWLYRLANILHLRQAPIPSTFLTIASLDHIAKISGYEIIQSRFVGFFPFHLLGIGKIINSICPALPLIRFSALTMVITLRPLRASSCQGLSIVVPARNERGNIEGAITRLPNFGFPVEVIFVEGHSSDNTWEEILRVKSQYSSETLSIQAFKQDGKGKNNAVRMGFSKASCDLLTILDADLTMPPELLTRFVEAWEKGYADFVNGSRLVYSMEGGAMRPLNLLGNVFFCKAISSVLGIRLSDTLCGTKLMERSDYERIIKWRKDFGDFDPFGDFEFLFAASILCLGNVDIPIRYLARTYGTTNISRFTHGLMLLRMTIFGFFRVRMGA